MSAHGTLASYQRGCRCDECREKKRTHHAEYRQRLRQQLLPAGDRRHGTLTGYTDHGCRCRACRRAAVRQKTIWQERKLYAPPPGYRPPSNDVDPVAVERAVAGDYRYTDLTKAERLEVMRRTMHIPASQLSLMLRITERSVVRLRARIRDSSESAA